MLIQKFMSRAKYFWGKIVTKEEKEAKKMAINRQQHQQYIDLAASLYRKKKQHNRTK